MGCGRKDTLPAAGLTWKGLLLLPCGRCDSPRPPRCEEAHVQHVKREDGHAEERVAGLPAASSPAQPSPPVPRVKQLSSLSLSRCQVEQKSCQVSSCPAEQREVRKPCCLSPRGLGSAVRQQQTAGPFRPQQGRPPSCFPEPFQEACTDV